MRESTRTRMREATYDHTRWTTWVRLVSGVLLLLPLFFHLSTMGFTFCLASFGMVQGIARDIDQRKQFRKAWEHIEELEDENGALRERLAEHGGGAA